MCDHRLITRTALACLSERDRAIWHGCDAAMADDYCTWPDQYFSPERYGEIAPYQLVINGLPFHYPPASEVRYHWRMVETRHGPRPQRVPETPNLNWQFMRAGFEHYLTKITADLRRHQVDEAGKRMGILLHVLQDTHELHALEGPWGVDCFVLDRIMPVPEGPCYRSPTSLLVMGATPCDIAGYQPTLEGASVDEAVFRLYTRYVQSTVENRRLHVPIIQARMQGDEDEARRLFKQINDRIARLSADVLHTVAVLARGELDDEQRQSLRSFPLDPWAATQRPWNVRGHYRFTALVPGACLDSELRLHPLTLRQADGSVRKFDNGWGSGAHWDMAIAYELPTAVYRRVQGQIGLHEPLGRRGSVDLVVLHKGHVLAQQRLTMDRPTLVIDCPVDAGGELRWQVQEIPGSDPRDNNLVWGDLRLVKSAGS